MKLIVRGSLVMLAALGLFMAGCGATPTTTPGKDKGQAQANKDKKDKGEVDDHSGWWCKEHGIPEHECSMCSPDYEKECKAKGDWCKEHERAMSQCFHCKPERRAFYAAKYKEKYDGQMPPPVPEFDKKKGK